MPDNYKQKIEKVQTIQNYLVSLMQTITNFVETGKQWDAFLNCINYPGCFVLFIGGDSTGVREEQNTIIHFDVVIKNRLENEMDNLDLSKYVMEKFENYQLNGNCIKCTPGFPKNYQDTIGETKTVQTVITLDIEI